MDRSGVVEESRLGFICYALPCFAKEATGNEKVSSQPEYRPTPAPTLLTPPSIMVVHVASFVLAWLESVIHCGVVAHRGQL